MGTSLIDNFDYRAARFLDSRQDAATLSALRSIPESTVPDGFRAYCAETGLWYEFNSSNTSDAATGRWRAIPTLTPEITDDPATAPSNRAVKTAFDINSLKLCAEYPLRVQSVNLFSQKYCRPYMERMYLSTQGRFVESELYNVYAFPADERGIITNLSGGALMWGVDKNGAYRHHAAYPRLEYQDGDVYFLVSIRRDTSSAIVMYGETLDSNAVFDSWIRQSDYEFKKVINDSELTCIERNLFDRDDPDFVGGCFLGSGENGYELKPHDSYAVTGYIPVVSGVPVCLYAVNPDTLQMYNFSGGGVVLGYWPDKTLAIAYGTQNTAIVDKVFVPRHTGYVRFSINNWRQNVIIKYNQTVKPYTSEDFPPKFDETLIPERITPDALPEVKPGLIKGIGYLPDGEISEIGLPDFPLYTKAGYSINCHAEFDTFSSMLIGKGYNSYTGQYIRITPTEIQLIQSPDKDTEPRITTTVQHDMEFKSFIKVSMYVDFDSTLYLIIYTRDMERFYQKTIAPTFRYMFHGKTFVKADGGDLKNIRMTLTASAFERDIWIFGDSYLGMTSSGRWPSYIRNSGFSNANWSGIAGENAEQAYQDLVAALQYGRPKYVFWCLGMNGSLSTNANALEKLFTLQKQYGFELVLCTIPTVPSRIEVNNGVNDIVRNSGYRYVDFKKAVGATDDGIWPEGYLSSDMVHPDTKGAAAMASQLLTDFPELFRYDVVDTIKGAAVTFSESNPKLFA